MKSTAEKLEALESAKHVPMTEIDNTRFAACAIGLQCLFIGLYAWSTSYSERVSQNADGDGGMDFYYGMYQDVHVMIFIGFGFLMTFLSRYSFSAIGFTFMIGALVIQWAILTNGFWHNVYHEHFGTIHLDIRSLIRADFVAGSVLITFGGILGKVSPLQLVVIAIIECFVQGASEVVGSLKLGAVDMGGSIFVHTFGAYFGLACSWALQHAQQGSNKTTQLSEHKKNGSSKSSDTFAMVGTLFLWLFWPSFNGALAQGSQQHRVVINTVLALAACCLSAFAASTWLRKHKKFDMVDIQNATLAGGVAVGSSSDLVIQPWGALLIGCIAGWLSVYGYVYLTPWLERRCNIHDTCGIHNLHGMPGILGAVGGAISASLAGDSHVAGDDVNSIFPFRAPSTHAAAVAQGWCSNGTGVVRSVGGGECLLGESRSAVEQGGFQMASLGVTLLCALVGGVLAGKVASMTWFQPLALRNDNMELFEDEVYWEVPEGEAEDETQGTLALHEMQVEMKRLQAALEKIEGGQKQ